MIIKPSLEQKEAVAMVIQFHHGGHGHPSPSPRKGECEDHGHSLFPRRGTADARGGCFSYKGLFNSASMWYLWLASRFS